MSSPDSARRVIAILKERKVWDACDDLEREEILREINTMYEYVTGSASRQWDYCPTCGGELDTGFECLSCELDWRQWAMAFEGVVEAGDDDN